MYKSTCQTRNWSNYNKFLRNRYSLDLIVSEDVLDNWISTKKSGKRGRPYFYSHRAIEIVLIVRAVFNLPLRGVQGFFDSISRSLNLGITSPDYSSLSRRSASLPPLKLGLQKHGVPRRIAVDSTGFKIIGPSEWRITKKGERCRKWRVIHIAIDIDTQEFLACTTSDEKTRDHQVFSELIDQIDGPISELYADGAYDRDKVFRKCYERGIRPIIPPVKGARLQAEVREIKFRKRDGPHKDARDAIIRQVRGLGCDKSLWKKQSGYHTRSLVETAMFRLKQAFSGALSSRKHVTMHTEAQMKCHALNKMGISLCLRAST